MAPETAESADSAPESPASAALAHAELAPPSWARVIGTTLRLWLHRRLVSRLRRGLRSFRSRRGVAVLAVLGAAVLFAAGALTIALAGGRTTASAPSGRPATSQGAGSQGPADSPSALAAAATARTQAARWVATQVSRSSIVACDPQMCAALQAAGFPPANLLSLGTPAVDPLGSAALVSTEVLRSKFGSKLDEVYAPAVLASFGTGQANVQVRVTAPDGSAAYGAALAADVAARRSSGAELLGDGRIQASATARRQLSAGQVDSRLLTNLSALASSFRVSVLQFADAGPGASQGMPLRQAVLALRPAGHAAAVRPQTVAGFLHEQITPFRVTSYQLSQVSRQVILRMEFAAPSQPGLLGNRR
ncbi:MAG TPA: hypothetical protein VGI64_11665 [Streptosporangiaceae bacterium]